MGPRDSFLFFYFFIFLLFYYFFNFFFKKKTLLVVVVFLVVVVEACDSAGMWMMLFGLGCWEGRGQGFGQVPEN
jgi:hypothetical protein